ncbi:MFS transporter [Salegentibacter sp. F188]|uniref:MFS transporter n=1 Tax=Autumnicola patrickiae TaxID=3075591 RepID=A0ABU3DZ53_9FLAO|nr:MFS transporter [Salegentibacter sp. F188]MDT0689018.1 MFS transporter [Salegentibacter sp. F188]
MPVAKHILPIIVFSQFCCTSLWFAGNAVMADLLLNYNLDASALGHLTSAVQLGFISGTLIFAIFGIADRFPPSRVFFICALVGAMFNFSIISEENTLNSLLMLRFLTGFSLAGIYPVGMKIATDYYQKGLGTSLGFLVGALVLGTAFPHLLKDITSFGELHWKAVLITTSVLSVLGGLLIFLFIPNGPYRTPKLNRDFTAAFKVFKNSDFKAAAFGYFGHMWELYAFWAFVPVALQIYQEVHPGTDFNIPLLSFLIIGSGGLACIIGGYISEKFGTRNTAATALFLSGCCCLLSPLLLLQNSPLVAVAFLIFWGIMVVADSPLFSSLVAQNAIPESRGTALTIVNSIGFGITILSIQLLNIFTEVFDPIYLFLILAAGPAFGLWAMFIKNSSEV